MMKKLFVCTLLIAGAVYLGLLPFKAHDVAELLPVETVVVTRAGDQYRVDIGAGVRAIGKTLSEALDRLKEQVSGFVFFQTAEQVIVGEDAADAARAAITEPRFRPAAGIYLSPEPDPDANAISKYLKTRPAALTLGEAKARLARGETLWLPRLLPAGGGYRIAA